MQQFRKVCPTDWLSGGTGQIQVLCCGVCDKRGRSQRAQRQDGMANANHLQSFATKNELTGTCCVFFA